MVDLYLWSKVVHLLGLISWMAGLFYLPRLFVYHTERGGNEELAATFCVMEGRLLRVIMRPALVVTVGAGGVLVWSGEFYGPVPLWLWGKMVLVGLLLIYHGVLERHAGRFRQGGETGTSRYFRVLNEVPTVLLVAIVILVVVKPY